MLVLFDVDMTLITTGGVGRRAMCEAGRRVTGSPFDAARVSFSGRLDPLILHDLCTAHELEPTPERIDRLRVADRETLADLVGEDGAARPLPGAVELVDALAERDHVVLGLLTGNFPETGAIKLRAAGVDPDRFHLHVWGCDSPFDPPAREHLPPIAMERCAERRGVAVGPDRVVVIGDTPHDVSCARAAGCRSLAVATGSYDRDALDAAGPDRVVDDLADTDDLLGWIMDPAAA